MKIEFNKEEIRKNIGVFFEDDGEYYLEYVKDLLWYLAHNNKNYTDKQYNKIVDITEILNNIKIVKE